MHGRGTASCTNKRQSPARLSPERAAQRPRWPLCDRQRAPTAGQEAPPRPHEGQPKLRTSAPHWRLRAGRGARLRPRPDAAPPKNGENNGRGRPICGLPLDHRRSKSDCDWTPVEDEGDHTPSTDLNSAPHSHSHRCSTLGCQAAVTAGCGNKVGTTKHVRSLSGAKHTHGQTARVSACLTVMAMLGTRRNPKLRLDTPSESGRT